MLERELFELLNGTADAAFTVDAQGTICSWNRAAERLFGYSSAQVLRKSCADLFQGTGSLGNLVCTHGCDVIDCAVADREIPNYDLQVKAHGGRRLWVNVSILAFHDKRSGRALAVHLARDITQRKKNEELTRDVLAASRQLVDQSRNLNHDSPALSLTEREKHVLRLLSEGNSPAAVARTLRITQRTLRNHLYHANQKLGTRSRLEAVIHAVRRGLI
jgi:PAS domain S-box-containing protein